MTREDLNGIKFGKLTVVSLNCIKNRKSKWNCECECGKTTIVSIDNLKSGHTTSCGCMRGKRDSGNKIEIVGDVAKVYLNSGEFFIIDFDDVKKISKIKWCKSSTGYIHGQKNRKNVSLHRFLMDCSGKEQIDHISGDKMDNRKSNLRKCSALQNNKNNGLSSRNKSGTVGVSFDSHANKWRAAITCNYKYIHLGLFDIIEDAINARKAAEMKYFGDFARGA